MELIGRLEVLLRNEESLFRAQLLREDIARLNKLEALAKSAADAEAFRKAGLRIGWTQGDARTHEIREPLVRLLDAVYASRDEEIVAAWEALHRARMEKLVGCLSTPVPKPVD
jgi:hypothetical protein